jgi:hypothetical protein
MDEQRIVAVRFAVKVIIFVVVWSLIIADRLLAYDVDAIIYRVAWIERDCR